jgi:Spy/CpxP family protein refolding chaperone
MTKLVVILGFLIAFTAGWVVGTEMRTSTLAASATPTTHPSGHTGGWLTNELSLNPQQAESINKIWSETARRGRGEMEDRRRQFRQDRDASIAGLVSSQDKDKLDAIQKNYTDQIAALDKETKDSFAKAVEQTKEILTPQQRTQYEVLLAKREADRAQRDQARDQKNGQNSGPITEQNAYNRRVEDLATTQPRPTSSQ